MDNHAPSGASGASGALREQLRQPIEDLLRVQATDMATAAPEMPEFLAIRPMDYDKEQKKARSAAHKTMHSLLKFYLSQDVIDQNEYIRAKAHANAMQLTSLALALKTSEHAIISLLKTIHSGNFHPRMFEVLAGMQKTMLDIVKMQTMQMVANEESMKKLKTDLGQGQVVAVVTQERGPVRGTRDLMRGIQDEIRAEFEDGSAKESGEE